MKYLRYIIKFITKKEVYGIFFTIAIAYFIYHTISIVLEESINHGKNSYEQKKRKTITKLFQNFTKYTIIIIVGITILGIYGINVKGMLAGLGIVATILGLALQDTFKDIINGINIILENYFVVGDIISYSDFIGEVIEFGLKSTKIKSAKGETLVIANRNIMEIKNISKEEHVEYLPISLPYEENIEKIERIIDIILKKVKSINTINPESVKYLGIEEMADSCVKYLIVYSCQRDTQWQTKRDVNRIILSTLNSEKVTVPYPQLEVHNEK